MADDDILGDSPPPGSPAGEPPGATPPAPTSPVPPPPAWTPPAAPASYGPRWRSVRGLGVAIQVLLWITVTLLVALIAALANERRLADDFFDGDFSVLGDLENASDVVDAIEVFYFLLLITLFVLFVIYLWRAAKNIEALGRYQPTLGAGWAIGAWFIPLANVILVPMVWSGAWKGTDPTVAPADPNWKQATLTPLLPLWWIAYVVASVVYSVGVSAFTDEDGVYETVEDFRAASNVSLAGSALLILAAVLGIVFIRRLTHRFDIWGRHLNVDGRPPSA